MGPPDSQPGPDTGPQRLSGHMDEWAGGREGPVLTWQGGEEGERVDKQRRQVWWPPPRSSSHSSHRSQGWMEANAHGHKHR